VELQLATSPGGEDFGWRKMEGSACYNPSTGCNDWTLVLPITEYLHASGDCSVTGGYVYRGTAIPEMVGTSLLRSPSASAFEMRRVSLRPLRTNGEAVGTGGYTALSGSDGCLGSGSSSAFLEQIHILVRIPKGTTLKVINDKKVSGQAPAHVLWRMIRRASIRSSYVFTLYD